MIIKIIKNIYKNKFIYIIKMTTNNNLLKEESYFVDVYIDSCHDEVAFETRYRFTTKELAEEFCKRVSYIQKCSLEYDHNIGYENTRSIFGYTDLDPYRPRFDNVVEALKDLNLCIDWCHKSCYSLGSIDYLYKGNIFKIKIDEYEKIFLRNTNDMLNKKVNELQDEVTMLKEEIAKLTNKN